MSLDDARRDLVERFLDESAVEADLERILGLLDSDPEFRAELAAALRMRGLLHGAHESASSDRLADVVSLALGIDEGRMDSRVMAGIEHRGRRARWAGAAAAFAAAWVLGIVGWFLFRDAPAILVAAAGADGVVVRDGAPLAAAPGLALRAGDVLRAPAGGWISIRYEDGTSLELGPDSALALDAGAGEPKRATLSKGRVSADVAPQPVPLLLRSPHAEARVLGTVFTMAATPSESRLLVRSGRVAFGGPAGSVEVGGGQAATALPGRAPKAEPIARELLRRLGKDRFLLGIMAELGETWLVDARAQGARMDLRYQHLAPGWTNWNKDGGFVTLYLQESEKQGTLPVFSYYSLTQASKGAEGKAAVRGLRADVMKRYFEDLQLFFRKAGAHGRPVILHVEPDIWGEFLSAADPSQARIRVGSAGLPELAGLDDTLASFGRAFSILRDRLAPNVLLAWHATRLPGGSGRAAADALRACGSWDFVFTDTGERDSGYLEARGGMDARWTEARLSEFRDWAAELHASSGLPLVLWRIPLGNRTMAACNDTPWHYTDDRAEYFLEGYPSNGRIAEWAKAGFVALLFGGGTVECTVHKDNAKDGVSNPPPIAGNKGERSDFPDDDGGYLRLRAGAYYRAGPLPLFGD